MGDEVQIDEERINENLKRMLSGFSPYAYFEFGRALGRLKTFSVLILSHKGKITYKNVHDSIDSILENMKSAKTIAPNELSKQIGIMEHRLEELFSGLKDDEILNEYVALHLDGLYEILYKEISENMKEISAIYKNILNSNLDTNIQQDIMESINSYINNCYKSSVILCRRVIQNELMKRGISSKRKNGNFKTIAEMIDEAKSRNIVDGKQHHNITSVRKLAGWSAHPQDDGLDDITKEDARKSLNATIQFLASLYSDENLKTLIID